MAIPHIGWVAVVVGVASNVQEVPFAVVERNPCGLVIIFVYHERKYLVVNQGLIVARVECKEIRCRWLQ